MSAVRFASTIGVGCDDNRFMALLPEDEARRKISAMPRSAEPRINWAGFDLPGDVAEAGLLVVGGVGSGKTRVLRALFRSLQPSVHAGLGLKMLVCTGKGDLLDQVSEMPRESEPIFINSGVSSTAWDLAADIKTPTEVHMFAQTIIDSDSKRTASPFFVEAAREALAAVIHHIQRDQPGSLTLQRIAQTTASREEFQRALRASERGRHFLPTGIIENVQITVATHLQAIAPVTALWEQSQKRISLKQWLQSGHSLLVIGCDGHLAPSTQVVNAAILKTIARLMAAEPDSPQRSRLWFFCDEPDRASLDVLPLLLDAREKGVRCAIGFQNLEGLFGRSENQSAVRRIIDGCSTVTWLRLYSAETARWASKRTGHAATEPDFFRLPTNMTSICGFHLFKGVPEAFRATTDV